LKNSSLLLIFLKKTLNSINVDHVDEIVDLAKELGVPVNFNLFKPFGECKNFLQSHQRSFSKQ